ncbi:unnamed protein product [Amoebophrya sp. A25]|nr:unnamed protein product [Amoebophrya sp. A25]|eukprot:GSA25T00000505001.1
MGQSSSSFLLPQGVEGVCCGTSTDHANSLLRRDEFDYRRQKRQAARNKNYELPLDGRFSLCTFRSKLVFPFRSDVFVRLYDDYNNNENYLVNFSSTPTSRTTISAALGRPPTPLEERYSLAKEVGRGSFGVVYEAKRKAGATATSVVEDLSSGPGGRPTSSNYAGGTQSTIRVAVKSWMLSQNKEPLKTRTSTGATSSGVVSTSTTKTTYNKNNEHYPVLNDRVAYENFCRERDILTQLDHPHIIKIFEAHEDINGLHLVLELCRGGELYRYVASHALHGTHVPEGECQEYLLQMVRGIGYLHAQGIVHRDVKTENWLFLYPPDYQASNTGDVNLRSSSKETTSSSSTRQSSIPGAGRGRESSLGSKRGRGRPVSSGGGGTDTTRPGGPKKSFYNVLKLCDFGTAILERESPAHARVGTLSYTSPEVYNGQPARIASDMWSLGVCFYVMLSGQSPLKHHHLLKGLGYYIRPCCVRVSVKCSRHDGSPQTQDP